MNTSRISLEKRMTYHAHHKDGHDDFTISTENDAAEVLNQLSENRIAASTMQGIWNTDTGRPLLTGLRGYEAYEAYEHRAYMVISFMKDPAPFCRLLAAQAATECPEATAGMSVGILYNGALAYTTR